MNWTALFCAVVAFLTCLYALAGWQRYYAALAAYNHLCAAHRRQIADHNALVTEHNELAQRYQQLDERVQQSFAERVRAALAVATAQQSGVESVVIAQMARTISAGGKTGYYEN